VDRAAERAGRYFSNSKGSIRPLSEPAQAELGRGTLVSSNDYDGPGDLPEPMSVMGIFQQLRLYNAVDSSTATRERTHAFS